MRVGCLLEFLPTGQILSIAGDRVRRHDRGRVDVLAGYSPICDVGVDGMLRLR